MTDKPKRDGSVWPRHRVDEALKMLELGIPRKMVARHFNSNPSVMRAAFIRHGVYKPLPSYQEMKDRIEQLEQALGHIYAWYPISVTQPRQTIDDIREFARAALGEKKDD